jgi:two-component sensor histidine kinase
VGLSELQPASTPIDLFITRELQRRPAHKPDYLKEKLALQDLARQMIDDPAEILPHLVDLALDICDSATGGISLYEEYPAPGVFRWHNLRGEFMKCTGNTTPRNYSPCGITLDNAEPTLVEHPERGYTWLAEVGMSLPELLLVPLYVGGKLPLGTLWIVSEVKGHFDSGHARVLEELAAFAGMAIHMLRTEERLHASLARQEMLTQEMSHRVKNLFMVVTGMIHVSERSAATPKDMGRILTGRLQALAEANALVHRTYGDIGTAHQVADLKELVEKILAPHQGAIARPSPFRIEGPPVELGERATNALALVCHELATNAAKYGALSGDSGTVHISWEQDGRGFLTMAWQERGGPAIEVRPATTGFGSILAKQTVVNQLYGEVFYDWQPQGLSVTISIPTNNLLH